MRVRVKICGFTRVEDALCAAELGVDAIGLVFYEASPRYIDPVTAAAVVSRLPAFVTVVGLFVDAKPDYIRSVLEQVRLDCLQFHGEEPQEACRIYGIPYIKALAMRSGSDAAAIAKRYPDARGLLLDAYHPGLKGGSGSRFDWDNIPAVCSLPIILAGGLTPENANTAARTVKPFALDVSSGVESAKGVKDAAKMAAFIKNINQL
jgi:phosphoribosylanthranilate isomerase